MSCACWTVAAAFALAVGCNSFEPSFNNPQCDAKGECPDGLFCMAGTCRPQACGDGVIVGSEICDDGNEVDGDGCDSTCSAATCFVSVTHLTITAGLADPACSTVYVYSGIYVERVTVSRDVAVVAVGAEPVVLDGDAGGSVVTVGVGITATLRGFTIRNGRAPVGGGVINRGALTLDAMTISDNVAAAVDPAGGGIDNAGTLTLVASIVARNRLIPTATPSSSILSGAGIRSTAGTVRLERASLVEANNVIVTGVTGVTGQGAGIWAGSTIVEISGASMVRDNVLDLDGSGTVSASGAGLYLQGGVFKLEDGSAVEGNIATARSTGRFNKRSSVQGGGFFARSTLVSLDATFVRNNQAVVLSASRAFASAGGGYLQEGALTVTSTEITANTVRAEALGTGSFQVADASAGGLYLADTLSVSISDSQLSANVVSARTASTFASSSAEVGALRVVSSKPQTITILHCAFDGNKVTSPTGSAVSGALQVELGGSGGGILNFNVAQTTISNNLVSGSSARAGAFFAAASSGQVLNVNIVQTSIHDNLASGVSSASAGAALAQTGSATVNLHVVNSTISGNRVEAPMGTARAGAIQGTTFSGSGKVNVKLASTTITGNSVTGMTAQAGGLHLETGSSPSMTTGHFRNSILAANSAFIDPDCNSIGAPISSGGYNLLGDLGSCALSGDLTGNLSGAAGLAPLGDNGGPTRTHALMTGSQAIDAGNPAGCTDLAGAVLTTDQRGQPRGSRCDIGAYER